LLALSLAVVAVLWLPLFAIERVTLITLAAPVLLPMALMLLFSPSAAPLAPMGSLLLLLLAAFFVVAKIFGRLLDSDRATQRTLYHQATHDALVGLINQAAFQRCVTALESAPSGPYAVVFIDLDRFKDVNDTLGHAAGDRLLQQVGGILREEKRKADVAARVGGDEFAILMELCSDREAMRVAAAILRRIGELDLRHNGWRLFVSASIGVACRSAESGTILSVVEAADQACYSAKRAGRNRIELARPERSNAHAHVVPTAARSAESMGSPPRLIREDSDGAAISSLG
jgi:diguanylate cyclase (GGDEF)-like protein